MLTVRLGQDVVALVEQVVDIDRRGDVAFEEVDPRAVILKLADRLHNLWTIGALTRDKQLRKAHETLEVLAPVADRLGEAGLAHALRSSAERTVRGDLVSDPAGRSGHVHGHRLPSGWSILRCAALLLPAESRSRWLTEWRGEIMSLGEHGERWRFAIDVLLGAPYLAHVVRRESPVGPEGRSSDRETPWVP